MGIERQRTTAAAGWALCASARGEPQSYNENAGQIRISVREASIHQRTPIEGKEAAVITANVWLFATRDGAFSLFCRFKFKHQLARVGELPPPQASDPVQWQVKSLNLSLTTRIVNKSSPEHVHGINVTDGWAP